MLTAGIAVAFVRACLLFHPVQSEAGVEIVDFKPSIYPSGSTVISLHDIGELSTDFSNTQDVLACRTDKSPCCSTNRMGNWTYNNGTVIGTRMNSGIDYYRSRDDNRSIYLSLRTSSTPPILTGQFCCVLRDSSNEEQTRCLEIVSTELSISVSSTGTNEVGQMYTITCMAIISGGTLTRISWLKDNIKIMDSATGNSLAHAISSLSTSDSGNYTCMVEAGNLSKITSLMLEVVTVMITSVSVSSSSTSGVAGVDSITLTCTATLSGSGTPSFVWTGPESRTSRQGQGSGPTFRDTFSLGTLRESYSGSYTCQVSFRLTQMDDSVVISVTVPSISVSVMESGTPTALRMYTLTCVLSNPSSLSLSDSTYTWYKNNSQISTGASNQLTIESLPFSDNYAIFRCQFTAMSMYLTNATDESGSLQISIQVEPISAAPSSIRTTPQTTSVILSWTQSTSDFVSTYTAEYTVTDGCSGAQTGTFIFHTSNGRLESFTLPNLSEDTIYSITLTAINSKNMMSATTTATTLTDSPNGRVNNLRVREVDYTSITFEWQPVPCLQQNGDITNYRVRYSETSSTSAPTETTIGNTLSFTISMLFPDTSYTFGVAAINSNGTGPYQSTTVSTTIPAEFGLLNGVLYPNNSVITINNIGEDGAALYCFTTISNCCVGSGSVTPRDWFFPNKTQVPNRRTWPISRSRGSHRVVLHRNEILRPTGVYKCQIQEKNLYFGIYLANEGFPILSSVNYNTTSGVLTCMSTGGPVTNVSWSRNGEQSKIVVDMVTATYNNLLSITTSQISDYTGSFTCTVSNSRGNDSMTTGIFQSIGLSGNEVIYNEGSSVSVSCWSNLTVQSLRWTSSPNISFNTNRINPQELILSIDVVRRSIHGTVLTCEVINSLPFGPIQESINFTINTEEIDSGPVVNLMVFSESNSNILITWSEPVNPNGIITSYLLKIFDLKINKEITSTNTANGNQRNFTRMNLEQGVPYNISIAAVNAKGPGKFSSVVVFTKELVSEKFPENIVVMRTSGTTMLVSWKKLTLAEARGFIHNYTIFYYPSTGSRKRQPSNAMTKDVDSDTNSTIIAGLDEDTEYSVQISANTGAGSGTKSKAFPVPLHSVGTTEVPSSVPISVIIGVVVAIILAIVFVVAIIIAVFIFRKLTHKRSKYDIGRNESVMYSRGSSIGTSPVKENVEKVSKNGTTASELEEDMNDQTYENTVFLVKDRMKPVPLKDFGAHVSRMHADRDKWFEMEYSSIEKSPKFDHDVAAIPENRARNRFGNIFPYDINRVKLRVVPDVEHSDYINASYVNGYNRKNVYIAAQGPMENSVEDFWRMIWEQRTPTIVMLTRVFEGKKKCEEYWPENTSDPFIPCSGSSLVIELKSSLPFAEFVMKKMVVSKTDEPKSPSLEVVLFHYLGWPDHGVPANAISMINFIKRVRKSHPYSKEDLMVVHCSAGVGRTGTFITLDYMLERIKNEKTINIYEFVTDLRKQRVLMVQTPAQYIFIHNALDELLTCGDTEVAAANMRIIIGKLSRPAEPGASMSGFQKQFDILGKVTTDVCTLDFSQSVNAANTEKNRYEDRIPFNHTRVRLRPAAAQGSDYINASFVEGYRQKGAYIATQGPLLHTVNDFWKMIWEYECRCIVMLCKSEENGKEACRRYWPQGKGSSEMYGKLMVSLNDQKNMGEYTMRKLEISEHQPRMSVTPTGFSITQFQYLRWQEDIVPNTTATVLEIANLVQKVQMSTGNKPIIVMCNDGVGRSGTFICMHAQMERMKAEAVVDVFQFIKSVRFQRAGLVANKAQYEFCHQVLADFLDGFDTYANFKDII